MEKMREQKGGTNQGSSGCFGVEEVDAGDKGEIQDSPDDVEFPVEVLDPDGGDLNDLCTSVSTQILHLYQPS
jgi:hypothetical protein